mgnify:CR=1 FL=1
MILAIVVVASVLVAGLAVLFLADGVIWLRRMRRRNAAIVAWQVHFRTDEYWVKDWARRLNWRMPIPSPAFPQGVELALRHLGSQKP